MVDEMTTIHDKGMHYSVINGERSYIFETEIGLVRYLLNSKGIDLKKYNCYSWKMNDYKCHNIWRLKK